MGDVMLRSAGQCTNLQVLQPTTPANYFHALRRQVNQHKYREGLRKWAEGASDERGFIGTRIIRGGICWTVPWQVQCGGIRLVSSRLECDIRRVLIYNVVVVLCPLFL